ncbi:MAG: redoxin domain-containing protein [Lachnospiraceae bacterium]|nr:redoxin domain-containing protein [Lachnospiraceae bacterium]
MGTEMFGRMKKGVVLVLAVLGVLFCFIMLLPDDGEEDYVYEDNYTYEDETVYGQQETAAAADEKDTEEIPAPEESSRDTGEVDIKIPEKELAEKGLAFRTTSIDSLVVTQEIFGDYDITVVHVWGTYSERCAAEMKNYQKLYEELPENINLIGIVCDVYDGINSNVKEAEAILDQSGTEYQNLRTSDSLYEVTAKLKEIPATFLVNREGRIIGEIASGAGPEDTEEKLKSYIVSEKE